jgi:hypothetical protein
LSKAVLDTDTGLCEWEIWGQSAREDYIWVKCIETQGDNNARSTPAVVYLTENGQIDKVTLPRPAAGDYWEDIKHLFPPDVLAKIRSYSFDGPAAEKRIYERIKSHEPPLIANPSGIIGPTPTSLPRWRLYEIALSKAVLDADTGLCEWEIWGQSTRDVYVWVECIDTQGVGTAASTPAVVYLTENGQIDKVTLPRPAGGDYWEDIYKLFPPDVLAKIQSHSFDAKAAEERIYERMKTNEPPLIATSGIVLP